MSRKPTSPAYAQLFLPLFFYPFPTGGNASKETVYAGTVYSGTTGKDFVYFVTALKGVFYSGTTYKGFIYSLPEKVSCILALPKKVSSIHHVLDIGNYIQGAPKYLFSEPML